MTEFSRKGWQVVVVVAENAQAAVSHIQERNADPDDQYIYVFASSVTRILGLRPPHVVRVDELGNWTKDRDPGLVDRVDALKREIEEYDWRES